MAKTFEWDPLKARINLNKHGVSFDEAVTAFKDPLSDTTLDSDHSSREVRFVMLGLSAKRRLMVVSYTQRGEVIRLISARIATRSEREIYEGYQASRG